MAGWFNARLPRHGHQHGRFDGTDVNGGLPVEGEFVIVADDSGHVRLFNAPVACRLRRIALI